MISNGVSCDLPNDLSVILQSALSKWEKGGKEETMEPLLEA
jgi:hypothetical protein